MSRLFTLLTLAALFIATPALAQEHGKHHEASVEGEHGMHHEKCTDMEKCKHHEMCKDKEKCMHHEMCKDKEKCMHHQKGSKVEFLGTNPDFPFSEAVRVGNMLFLSGQIGIDQATGQLAEGGIQPETRQTLTNISNTLEKYGAGMDDVVKCLVMLADIAEWPAMNDVYKTFFTENKPARSAFAGTGLALNSRVEIECIAVVE